MGKWDGMIMTLKTGVFLLIVFIYLFLCNNKFDTPTNIMTSIAELKDPTLHISELN